jgi:hypothetical protein
VHSELESKLEELDSISKLPFYSLKASMENDIANRFHITLMIDPVASRTYTAASEDAKACCELFYFNSTSE